MRHRAHDQRPSFWSWLRTLFRRRPWDVRQRLDEAPQSGRFAQAETPWGSNTFREMKELVDDPHVGPLARVLKQHAPLEYMQFVHVVVDVTLEVEKVARSFSELKREELMALQGLARAKERVATLRAELAQQLRLPLLMPLVSLVRGFGEFDSHRMLTDLFAAGLSFMLFKGLLEQWRIEITDIASNEVLLVTVVGVAALAVTFSIKSIVSGMVQNRGVAQGQAVPFWELLRRGDGALYLCLGFIAIEVAFASPSMIQLLPLSVRDEFWWRVSACMSSGMFALVNVSLGWVEGAKQLREGGAIARYRGSESPVTTFLEWRRRTYRELCCAREEVAMYEEALLGLNRDITTTQQHLAEMKERAIAINRHWQRRLNELLVELRQRGVGTAEIEGFSQQRD